MSNRKVTDFGGQQVLVTKPPVTEPRYNPDDTSIEVPIARQNAVARAMDSGAITINPYALAPEEIVEGTDAFGGDDLKIPHMILVQSQHADIPENDKRTGELYNDLTGEFRTSVTSVLLSAAKGRAAFDRTFSRDSEPLCGSDDAEYPRNDFVGHVVSDPKLGFQHTIGIACPECPLSKFGADGTPPMCAKTFSYAMLDLETGLPFIMRAQRTAASAGKQLNTIAKTLGRRKVIAISSRKVTSDQGNYYVPVFTASDPSNPDTAKQAAAVAAEWGNIAARVSNGNGMKALPSSAPSANPNLPEEEELPF